MPKIPTYGGQQVNEAPLRAPMNPTEAPLEAFGGGRAAAESFGAAANIGQGIEQIAGQEYRKQYQDAVNQQSMEAANKLLAEQTRLKMSMADLSGPEAQKATGSVMGDYEKFYQNLEKDLQNSDVRKNVYGHYLSTQGQLNEWAQHTAYAKMKQYDQEEFTASGKALLDSVSVDPSMKNVVDKAFNRKLAIREFAERQGLGPEWVKAQQAEQSSKIYFSALNSLATSGQAMAAKNFFDINKADFVGDDLVRAQRLVEDSSRLGLAYRVTDGVFAKPQATLADAKARAKEIAGADYEDADNRKEIDQQVERRFHQDKMDQKLAGDKAFEDAARVVEQTGDPSKIDRNTWLNVLTNEDRVRITSRAMQLSKPPRVEDDPKAYLDWKAIPDDLKAGMSKRELYDAVDSGKFTTKTMEKIGDEWEMLRRREDRQAFKWKHDDTVKTFQAMQQTGLFGLTGSDRLGTMKGDKNLVVMKFLKDAEAQMTAEARGEPMTQEQKDKVIDQMIKDEGTVEQMTPSWWQYVAPFGAASNNIPAFSSWWGTTSGVEVPEKNKTRILKSYPGASASKIQMLYQAEQQGVGPYGLKLIGDRTK